MQYLRTVFLNEMFEWNAVWYKICCFYIVNCLHVFNIHLFLHYHWARECDTNVSRKPQYFSSVFVNVYTEMISFSSDWSESQIHFLKIQHGKMYCNRVGMFTKTRVINTKYNIFFYSFKMYLYWRGLGGSMNWVVVGPGWLNELGSWIT